MSEAQIAVLIDYENVGLGSMQTLFDQLSDVGRIIVKRAYADWSVSSSRRDQVLALGIEAVHYFHATGSSKNASDICLSIDAVDLLYRSPVDTFVIVSSDSDFVPLVSKLRAAGKTVIGAGREGVVSRTLVTSCDRYINLGGPKKPQNTPQPASEDEPSVLLLRALAVSLDDQGRALGGRLYQAMTRIDPSFHFRSLGYRTFSQFLTACPEVVVHRGAGGTDVQVEPRPLENGDHEPAQGQAWTEKLDASWSRRTKQPGDSIHGSWAASEVHRVLGTKLSDSRYKTLQGLLDAEPELRKHWTREGNSLIRQ